MLRPYGDLRKFLNNLRKKILPLNDYSTNLNIILQKQVYKS